MSWRLNKSKWVHNIYKPIVEVGKKTVHAPLQTVQYSQLSINRGPLINGGAANSRFSNWVQNAGAGCINQGGCKFVI